MKRFLSVLSICITASMFFSCNQGQKANANESVSETANNDNMEQPAKNIQSDTYITDKGDLKVTLVGHGSVMFEYAGKIIHIDPYSKVADYSTLPKADLIILTHEHSDHLDIAAIDKVKKDDTRFILTQVCNDSLKYGEVMKNGDNKEFEGVAINAVSAYNIVNKRPDGEFYHPKGRGNGYVFTFGDKKIYVAGDTENIPEMKTLKDNIYIAFMPKNLPYTMTDDMFIDAAKMVNPAYLYPYHFSEIDEDKIDEGLKDTNIKVLVRPMSNL